MTRRLRNKELQENSDSESNDNDSMYQQEEDRDEPGSPTPSPGLSPTPSPILSPSPASPSSTPRQETLFLKRVTRSFTAATTKTPKAPKALKTPKNPKILETPSALRTIVTRTRVNKKHTTAQGFQSEVDIESVGDPDPNLLKTPTEKKPRPRTKIDAGGKAQSDGEVESEGNVKSVKTPTPKKPGAKSKGHGAGVHPEEGVESEEVTTPVKTPTPKRPRAKFKRSGAARGRVISPVTPKKPRVPHRKKSSKKSVSVMTPTIASIQGSDIDGDGSLVGLPTKVWSPLDSSMDGIESAAMLPNPNGDCEMMPIAIPQQEHNCRGAYDALSRSPTVLIETPIVDNTGQDTARVTDMRNMFSLTIEEELRSPALSAPAVLVGRRQTGSSVPDGKHMLALPVQAESHVLEPLGSGPICPTDATRLISSQTPPSSFMTPPRSAVLKLDLRTVQPWKWATVPTPMSSMPSFLARINNTCSANTTPYTATLAPPEIINNVAKIVDKTYDEASQYLFGAMTLTKRALADQAHAIRFHTVAFEVFGQRMTMTESQCQILFPQEHFAFLATSALLASPPLQAPLAADVSPLSVTLTPQAQTLTSTRDESLLINVVKNMKRELETPVELSGYGSAKTRSSSYSPYLSLSRPISSTSRSPPSTPSRSPMAAPIPIRRYLGEWGTVVPWLSSSDFANDSVQPSVFAHNREGCTTTPPPPRSSSLSSVQASDNLVSSCAATSFGAIMSAANQHYSYNALKIARRKVLYEHFQRRGDENVIQSGAKEQQRDSILSQQQERPLAMCTFATPRVQQEDYHDIQSNQEVDMGHLKATTEMMEEIRTKEEEAGPIRIQLTLSQWSRIEELSTELFLKAVKSYEDSRDADRVASESHDRFMDARKRWYAVTGHRFP